MRTIALALIAGMLPPLGAMGALAAEKNSPTQEYPGEVALLQTDAGGYTYRHFPSNLRLYIYDKDPAGKSVCTDKDGCLGVWPPLIAPDGSTPMGQWTIVKRDDTRTQWAYKGHPVYLHYHDSPDKPSGEGAGGVWHFLEP